MGVPSGMELFVIVAVIVLLFGGKKIPELAKGLGQGIKNFKNAVKDDETPVSTASATTASSEKIEAEKPHVASEVKANSTETKTV